MVSPLGESSRSPPRLRSGIARKAPIAARVRLVLAVQPGDAVPVNHQLAHVAAR